MHEGLHNFLHWPRVCLRKSTGKHVKVHVNQIINNFITQHKVSYYSTLLETAEVQSDQSLMTWQTRQTSGNRPTKNTPTNTQTHKNPQTGPITIHRAAASLARSVTNLSGWSVRCLKPSENRRPHRAPPASGWLAYGRCDKRSAFLGSYDVSINVTWLPSAPVSSGLEAPQSYIIVACAAHRSCTKLTRRPSLAQPFMRAKI